MAVYLAVAGNVFDCVLLRAVRFSYEMFWMNFGTEFSQFIRIFVITLAILKQVEKDNRMQCYISAIMCILYTPMHSPSLLWLVALDVLRRQSPYLSDFIVFCLYHRALYVSKSFLSLCHCFYIDML